MSKRKQVFEIFRATTPGEIMAWLQGEFKSTEIEKWMTKYGLALKKDSPLEPVTDEGIALIAMKYANTTTNMFTWDAYAISSSKAPFSEEKPVIVTKTSSKRLGQATVEMYKAGERTQIIGYCDNDELQPFLMRLQVELERVFHVVQEDKAEGAASPMNDAPTQTPSPSVQRLGIKGKPRRYTEENLKAVLEERQRNRNRQTGEVRRGIYPICKALNMKVDTIKKHWPELHKRWKDPGYNPQLKDLTS